VSDEVNELRRRLTAATAADCPAHLLSDAETAALREGWLALGELLEAAQPTLDEPVRLRQPPPRRVPAGWRLAGAAAVAASVLLGTMLVWQGVDSNRRGGTPSPSGGLARGVEEPDAPSEPLRPMPTEDELAWDDPLDDQIASAGQQILRLQQDWDYLDDAFGPVYHGLEEMEDELDESTL
jgi:hypothetical protein